MSNQSLMVEGIPMRGTLCVTVRDASSRAVQTRVEIRNKITFLAADVLARMIAQRTPPDDPLPAVGRIYSMRIGTSNTAASRSDTNLGAFAIGKVILDTGKLTGAPGEITFTTTLESGDANGLTLREAGLFTAGDTPSADGPVGTGASNARLFARQVHPDVPKTAAIVIDYSWTIAFTATP